MSNDLQNKLFHFEADPPKEVWNKIVDALDTDAGQEFPQRLFQYEVQPPSKAWATIEAALDEPEPAIKVVPITKFKKPLRYIAAAASILAAVLLVSNLTDKKTGAGSVVGSTETVTTTNQSSILPLDKPAVTVTTVPADQLKPSSTTQRNEVNVTAVRPQRRTASFIRPQTIFRSITFSQRFIPQKADKEIVLDVSAADHYMVYSDEDGHAMRVPKKFFDLVYCKDGDDPCKERIRQLQKKMASAATSTDFGSVLEILRQLQ